jgi:hypothetical protein
VHQVCQNRTCNFKSPLSSLYNPLVFTNRRLMDLPCPLERRLYRSYGSQGVRLRHHLTIAICIAATIRSSAITWRSQFASQQRSGRRGQVRILHHLERDGQLGPWQLPAPAALARHRRRPAVAPTRLLEKHEMRELGHKTEHVRLVYFKIWYRASPG